MSHMFLKSRRFARSAIQMSQRCLLTYKCFFFCLFRMASFFIFYSSISAPAEHANSSLSSLFTFINIIVSLSISFSFFFPLKMYADTNTTPPGFWGPSKKDFGWRGFVAKLICWSTLILGFPVANYPRWWRRKARTGPHENSPVRFPYVHSTSTRFAHALIYS